MQDLQKTVDQQQETIVRQEQRIDSILERNQVLRDQHNRMLQARKEDMAEMVKDDRMLVHLVPGVGFSASLVTMVVVRYFNETVMNVLGVLMMVLVLVLLRRMKAISKAGKREEEQGVNTFPGNGGGG